MSEIKLELKQTPLYSKSQSVIVPSDGVGLQLEAKLNVGSKSYVLYDGVVRSITRDHFEDKAHFYVESDPVVKTGDEVSVTLRSKSLEDTYILNLKTEKVRLEKSVNLEELAKSASLTKLIDSVDVGSFKDVVEKYERMAENKHYVNGCMTPTLFPTFIDESKDLAVISIGRHEGSYDPYMSDLFVYLVKSDGSFQKLPEVDVSENAPYSFDCRPKFSFTSFQLEKLVLENDSLKLIGRSIRKNTGSGASSVIPSDSATYELPISDTYRSIDNFLE